MPKTPADLPDSVEDLRALVLEQQAAKQQLEARLAEQEQKLSAYSEELSQLHEYIRLLKSPHFGPKSERSAPGQMGLFNEAETLAEGEAPDAAPDVEVPAHTRRQRGGRRPLPAYLPREQILHDLPDDQKVCPNDPSHPLAEIGRDTLEQLAIVPARAKVIEHVRPKYACSTCKDGVHTAALPPQPIPKSLATPSLLAQVAASKYVDALPLARQETIFRRIGVDLSRGTLASWMIRAGELVDPLVARFLEEIRSADYVQADETPFQVLKENGKRATSASYLWALAGGPPEAPLHTYVYDPTRSGQVPKRLLRGFAGYLHTDGYAGYDAVGAEPGIVHVGCFAHARRKFDEALRGQGKRGAKGKSASKPSVARQGLRRINELYEIERRGRDGPPEERHALRQAKTRPKLDELRTWLDESLGRVPPKSLTGKALGYLDSQWPKLIRVLEDGRIPLDTNRVERSIRPFVIGRRNWLFADTPKGAQASANLYSLVETAKANGIEPWTYLHEVFEKLPAATTDADVEALLPWNLRPAAD
ncbi:MAG: IS66 family transposase [Proteobacteria bacterium]|nr:IS66 family transposase [Pseudomonadota bacterium]